LGYIFNQNLYAHILNNGWFRDVSCLPNLGSLGKLSPVMGILPWMKILLDYFWNKYKLQHCTVQQTAQTDRKVQSEPKTVMIHFYVFLRTILKNDETWICDITKKSVGTMSTNLQQFFLAATVDCSTVCSAIGALHTPSCTTLPMTSVGSPSSVASCGQNSDATR
jgi:hypothetical protein